jgi:hypothetical protein
MAPGARTPDTRPDSDGSGRSLVREILNEEIEFVWSLHGGMFYYAVRQHVYQMPMQVDFMRKVEWAVDNFLAGAKTTYPRLLAEVSSTANLPAQKSKGSRTR